MILVNRRLLIVLMVLTTFLLIFCGFYSWYILMQSNAMEALQLKLLAEQVLFIAIICSTVNYSLFLLLLYKSFRFSKELKKQVKLSHTSNYRPEKALKKLGKTGKQIAEIFSEVTMLSEKKSIKIGSLHALCAEMLNQNEKKMLVLSSRGIIQYAGENFLKESGLKKSDCEGKNIETVLEIPEILEEIASLFESKEKTTNKEKGYTLSAVVNHKRESVFALCVCDKKITDFISNDLSEAKNKEKKRANSLLGKSYSDLTSFLGRKKRQPK